jgi:hypothetical protein
MKAKELVGRNVRITSSIFGNGHMDGYISSYDSQKQVWWVRQHGAPKDAEAYGVSVSTFEQMTLLV